MKLKVGLADFPPLVFQDHQQHKGFEIDLWEAIAAIIGVEFEYEQHSFKEIIPLLVEKKIDIGLAGITINEQREKSINFSHAILDSGLLIAVNRNKNALNVFKSFMHIVSGGYKAIVSSIFFLLLYIFVSSNVIWIAERRAHTFSTHYFPGIFESLWLTLVSITTVGYGDYVPHTWLGRIIVGIVILSGAVILSLMVAQITAFLAVKKMKGEISSTRDLFHKKVATVEGSTSEEVLRQMDATIVFMSTLQEAYTKLKHEEIDAIVFDAPALLSLEKDDKDSVELIGEIFGKQSYGIALQQPSAWEEKINQAVLNLKESGEYDLIYRKWFGEDLIMEI
ncbi:MAG: transporter substrate-binding domain-containing protein [Patescibacteria group bacterium]|nr:transporter substrate-binding domain-containing protein [Patescibacteria group bacterium]MDE2438563.1 transporter substrate-binding domain-containing protein [Patescibacteria group bacterium]